MSNSSLFGSGISPIGRIVQSPKSGQASNLVRVRTVIRIGLGAALVYATSLALAPLPNLKLTFLLVAAFGMLWGAAAGFAVGALGTLLWSLLNPYGPAIPPLLVTQVFGMGLVGLTGEPVRVLVKSGRINLPRLILLSLLGAGATLLYFVPVNLIDAWLFQPFLPRFWAGMIWTIWPVLMNAILFPVALPLLKQALTREHQS